MKNGIAGLILATGSALLCPLSPSLSAQPGVMAGDAPICVTTWDLQPGATAGANALSSEQQQTLFREAAESLNQLRPDVIILQQVADLETCHQLVRALRPEIYRVAICSSFRDPRGHAPVRQVAILSKAGAFAAWSEPWRTNGDAPAAPGGFAFAALRLGGKSIGIFSVQLSDGAASGSAAFQQAGDDSTRQLVQEIASVQNWGANRLRGFIVAGAFNTTPGVLPLLHEKTMLRLEQIGFESAFAGLPSQMRAALPGHAWRSTASLDYIFTRDAGLIARTVTTPSALSEHDAVTLGMALPAPMAAPVSAPAPPPPPATVEPPPAEPAPSLAARPSAAPAPAPALPPATAAASNLLQTVLWFGICLGSCLVIFLLARKLPRRSKFPPAPAALPDVKPNTGVILASAAGSPPYVQVEIGGSTQTQSQTWRPRPGSAGPAGRMPEAVRAGVVAHLSRWLKQQMVQRLVSDRARLLANQQAAALKVLEVDERLARVEQHIQRRNQEYEQRIDSLMNALVTAREENRELIRAQIAVLKAEMGKAALKADPHSREHPQY